MIALMRAHARLFFKKLNRALDDANNIGQMLAAFLVYCMILAVIITVLVFTYTYVWPIGVAITAYIVYAIVRYALNGGSRR